MIIQVIGLPGSGKTTLSKALLEHTDAIHLNADEVRADLNKETVNQLGYDSDYVKMIAEQMNRYNR